MRLALVICAALCPTAAHPAAWPRGEGNTFVSLSGWTGYGGSASLYVERGVTRRLTLGAKFDRLTPVSYQGQSFVHLSFRPDATWQVALEIGVSAEVDTTFTAYGMTAIDYGVYAAALAGRGFETRFGNAWIDTRFERAITGAFDYSDVTVTLGLAPTDRQTVFADLSATLIAFDRFTDVTPTYGYAVTDAITLVSGIQIPLDYDGEPRLKLGLWAEF